MSTKFNLSNIPTNTKGEFTNVREDFYSNKQVGIDSQLEPKSNFQRSLLQNTSMNVPSFIFLNVYELGFPQGLWSNAQFNTPGATLDRQVGTYSNLQGKHNFVRLFSCASVSLLSGTQNIFYASAFLQVVGQEWGLPRTTPCIAPTHRSREATCSLQHCAVCETTPTLIRTMTGFQWGPILNTSETDVALEMLHAEESPTDCSRDL